MLTRRRSLSLLEAAQQLNAVNWPLVVISGLFLFLRIFLKLRQRRVLWWDDYILVTSWLALLTSSALFARALTLGYGLPPSQVSPESITEMLIVASASSSLLILANLWSKTSFGIILLRLPLGTLRIALIHALITLATISIGTSAFLVWLQCLSASPPWSPFTGSSCLDPQALIHYSMFVGIFSAVVDIAFVVIPWGLLWGLEMKRTEKVGVTLAMGMGVFAGITALVKTGVFPRVYTDDVTAGIQVAAWGALETAVSVMAASIPILRALVRQEGGGGVPRGDGYETGEVTVMRSGAGVMVVRSEVVMSSDEREYVVAGKALSVGVKGGKGASLNVGDDERTSFEMESYGVGIRPRDFTV